MGWPPAGRGRATETGDRGALRLPSLRIFFPAYYDEQTIGPLAAAADEVAARLTADYEILIIEDHSPDATGAAADEIARERPAVRVIHHRENLGVGATMIEGFSVPGKDFVFYTDGDAQYDLGELPLLARHAATHGLVAGYRLSRADGPRRALLSRAFHLLCLLLFGVRHQDIDCSFKLVSRDLLDRVRFRSRSPLVDLELFLWARRLGVPVAQVGVHHYPRRFGSSRCCRPGVILSMFADLIRLRVLYWLN